MRSGGLEPISHDLRLFKLEFTDVRTLVLPFVNAALCWPHVAPLPGLPSVTSDGLWASMPAAVRPSLKSWSQGLLSVFGHAYRP